MTDKNEEKNGNDFYNEKELLKHCKSVKRENKKSKFYKFHNKKKTNKLETENQQKNNKLVFFEFLSKIKNYIKNTIFIICIIFLTLTLYYVSFTYIDAFLCFPIKRFNIQIANYSITDSMLFGLDISKLQETSFAYLLRKSLLKQYKHIYKTNDVNSYNVIGIFDKINNDFACLSPSNKNDIRYMNYKKDYLLELEKILQEYTIRKNSSDKFLKSKKISREEDAHIIPNRIVLYISLAYSYYISADLENIETNQECLRKLKDILYGYDTVLNQETSKESYHIPFNYTDKQLYDYFYDIFNYLYAQKIIQMEDDLNPKTFCENKELFNKYLTASNRINRNTNTDIKVKTLLKNKCSR